MDDKEKTVGAILKEARLAKGISLADAEKATSIRSRYLQAVENDEYDKTPGEVFLKGIIRNYGNYLGLNGPELVNEYKASAAGMAAEAVRSQGIREVEKVHGFGEFRFRFPEKQTYPCLPVSSEAGASSSGPGSPSSSPLEGLKAGGTSRPQAGQGRTPRRAKSTRR